MAGSLIRLDAWTKVQGSTTPPGATWVDSAQAWNFAFYSTEATAVRLLIYGKDDFVNPIRSYDLARISTKPFVCGISWCRPLQFLEPSTTPSKSAVRTVRPTASSLIPARSCSIPTRAASFCPQIFRVPPRLLPLPTTEWRRWLFSRLKVPRRLSPTIVRCHTRTT